MLSNNATATSMISNAWSRDLETPTDKFENSKQYTGFRPIKFNRKSQDRWLSIT